VDARRLPHLQTAPQVLFSKDVPRELSSLGSTSSSSASAYSPAGQAQHGYITFVLFPRHTDLTPGRGTGEKTISLIQTFRDYLHYHIKCAKAYLHARLRARVSEYLKVLNRAKPQYSATGHAAQESDKKTASGRTFRRS
jgi:actin related protein 2/3 complex subunit 2